MSITNIRRFPCGRCDSPIRGRVAKSVNAVRHPHMRAAIIGRRFHIFSCPACEAATVIECDFLYIDLERRQFFGVFPPGDLDRARERAETVAEAFETALHQPESREGFQVRVCFGLEELREKIVAAEAGLDDLTLEALKADVLAGRRELAQHGVQTLRLDGVHGDTGELRFFPEIATEPPSLRLDRMMVVERELYDAVDAPWPELLQRHPFLASGPHVSLLRGLTWDAAG